MLEPTQITQFAKSAFENAEPDELEILDFTTACNWLVALAVGIDDIDDVDVNVFMDEFNEMLN
jgi:hypothetical protein